MSLSVVSLAFDCVLATLLAAMIYYAVRLNRRISVLREREAEMLDMVTQFNQSAEAANASARKLRAAGAEAEMLVKAAIAKGIKLRDDLDTAIDRAEFAAESLDSRAIGGTGQGRAAGRPAAPTGSDPSQPAVRGTHSPREAAVRPFVPPSRSVADVVRDVGEGEGDEDRSPAPRSEAERELLAAIRAAKQGIA